MSYFYASEAYQRGLFADPAKPSAEATLHVVRDISIEESAGGVEEKTVHTLCGQDFFRGYYLHEDEFPDPEKVERLRERLCPACVDHLDRTGKIWKLLEGQEVRE